MNVRCGADLVEVERVEKAIKTNAGFSGSVFTDPEIHYCEARNAAKYKSYAARFAAKEAFMKALGIGLFAGAALTEIEVVNDAGTGAPTLNLSGGAAELYRQRGGLSLSVSLSHTDKNAFATVVMLCE